MIDHDHHSPGDRLEAAIDALPDGGVTLAEVRDIAGRDGLMLLTVFLTVVFLIPISIPGVSTVFGAGILLIALSRLFRRDLRLPGRIERRTIETHRLRGALQRGLAWFRRLERFSRPHRMKWAISGGAARVVNDCGLVIGALLLMAPFGLVPFSNTLPAIALLFLATGALQRDGTCVVLGHAAIVATVIYFAILLGGGGLVVMSVFERLSFASASDQRSKDAALAKEMRTANVKIVGERAVVWAPPAWPEAKRKEVTASLDGVIARAEKMLGRTQTAKIEYLISDSDELPSHVYGAYGHSAAKGDPPVVFLSGLDSGEAPHIHETVHIVGGEFGSLLLREGMATYVQLTLEPGKKMRPLVRMNVTDRKSLDTAAANILARPQGREAAMSWIANPRGVPDFESRQDRALFYAVSASFTAFLVDRLGMETVMKAYAADDPRSVIPAWQSLADEWAAR